MKRSRVRPSGGKAPVVPALFTAVLVCAAGLIAGGAGAQEDTPAGGIVPANPTVSKLPDESGIHSVPTPPVELIRGGLGTLEEVPNGMRQSGDAAMVFERRKANELHESLRQLLLAVVEGDALGVTKGRQECQTLLEVVQENNPSDVIRDDLGFVRARLQDPKRGDPEPALVKLQLDVEQLSLLYPLQEFDSTVAAAKRLQEQGKADACRDVLDPMTAAAALPDLDDPIGRTGAAFQAALKALDGKQPDEARRQLKAALAAIGQLPNGTLLVQSEWSIAQANQALEEGLRAIAAGNLRNARKLIESAGVEAPPAQRASYASILKDVDRLILATSDHNPAPLPEDMRAVIMRIDKEL